MKKSLILPLLGVLFLSFAMASVEAADVDTLFIRAKAGPLFLSKTEPVTSDFGVGLDLGFRNVSGFGIAGMARMGFGATEYVYTGSSNTSNTSVEVQTMFLGAIPSYSVNKGIATLSFGLGIGGFTVKTEIGTSANRDSKTRLALVPSFDLDLALGAGLLFNIGIQHIATLGSSPHAGATIPMAGFGYNF